LGQPIEGPIRKSIIRPVLPHRAEVMLKATIFLCQDDDVLDLRDVA